MLQSTVDRLEPMNTTDCLLRSLTSDLYQTCWDYKIKNLVRFWKCNL